MFCPTAGSPDDLGFADVVCTLLCVLAPPAASKENPRHFQCLHVVCGLVLIELSTCKVSNMYLLTEWEGRTGKYLARGQDVRTELSEVRAA